MAGGPARSIVFIGLTGGIGSGKSTALELLRELGAATISADAVVHDLYTHDDVQALLVARFGDGVVESGAVDRPAVAERVFAQPAELQWLEELLWPRVREAIAEFRAAAEVRDPRPRAIVVETPLLFEAGMAAAHDVTVAIVADEERRQRWAAHRGHTAVAEREGRQLTQGEKAALADHVIRNDGSIEELRDKLAALLDDIEARR